MKNLPLIFCGFLFLTLGCSGGNTNTTSTTSTSSTPNVSSSPVKLKPEDYPTTIAGQAQRIGAEGLDDEQISKNIAAVNKDITYEHLKKNALKYAGQPWAVKGKILQIQESGGDTMARVALDSWGNKVVWVVSGFTTDFIEGNQIYAVGYLAGDYSYESQAGWNITIPALVARAIIKPNEVSKYQTQSKKK
jgi:hypothetical protein